MIIGVLLVAIGVFLFVFMLMGKKESSLEAKLGGYGDEVSKSISENLSAEGGLSQYENLLLEHSKPAPLDVRSYFNRTVGKQFDKTDRAVKMATILQKADLKLRPSEWSIVVACVGCAAGLIFMLRMGIIGFFIGYAVAWFGTRIYLRRRMSARIAKFESQLGPTILALSNGVKAGYTLAQAMNLTAQNSPHPMGTELGRVVRESQLGIPFIEAFAHMVERSESEDLKLLLTAVQIQQTVGGNLANILDNIEFTIRERVRIKGEIKTITSQARASGWVLILLPGVLGSILYFIAPAYFDPMFQKLPGQIMLGIALFMMAGGYAVIRKVVQVEV